MIFLKLFLLNIGLTTLLVSFNKKVKPSKLFLYSFFLTFIVGIILLLNSKKSVLLTDKKISNYADALEYVVKNKKGYVDELTSVIEEPILNELLLIGMIKKTSNTELFFTELLKNQPENI